MLVMGVENFFNWSKIKRGQHGLKLLVVKWVPVRSSGLVISYREKPSSGELKYKIFCFCGSSRSSGSHNLRLSVRLVQVRLELSILIFCGLSQVCIRLVSSGLLKPSFGALYTLFLCLLSRWWLKNYFILLLNVSSSEDEVLTLCWWDQRVIWIPYSLENI